MCIGLRADGVNASGEPIVDHTDSTALASRSSRRFDCPQSPRIPAARRPASWRSPSGCRPSRSAAPAPPCVSLNSRAFSMAITAWSAKVCSSSICSSVNGRGSGAKAQMAPIDCPRRAAAGHARRSKPTRGASPSVISDRQGRSGICTVRRSATRVPKCRVPVGPDGPQMLAYPRT